MTARLIRSAALLALVGAALVLLPSSAQARHGVYRGCSGSDAANGITAVRVLHASCPTALSVAKRTNRVKCFLNGTVCTHRHLGRSWTCRLQNFASSSRVTCRSGLQGVRYRLG